MSPETIFSAVGDGGRIFIWVDYLDSYIQVNKKELSSKIHEDGCSFIFNAKAFVSGGDLYINKA